MIVPPPPLAVGFTPAVDVTYEPSALVEIPETFLSWASALATPTRLRLRLSAATTSLFIHDPSREDIPFSSHHYPRLVLPRVSASSMLFKRGTGRGGFVLNHVKLPGVFP